MELTTVLTLLTAWLVCLFMAWIIGAGLSGSTPFAPAVGANAISILRAGFLIGILGLLGAVFQGANASTTVGGELVGGVLSHQTRPSQACLQPACSLHSVCSWAIQSRQRSPSPARSPVSAWPSEASPTGPCTGRRSPCGRSSRSSAAGRRTRLPAYSERAASLRRVSLQSSLG